MPIPAMPATSASPRQRSYQGKGKWRAFCHPR